MVEPVIRLRGVSKRFGSTLAVDSLDLEVPGGSLFGFIGPNGSGKTTTLRMILRILFPSSGDVVVLGRSRGEAADDRTGYLPEERGLTRRMRVREVLRFHARLKGERRPGAAADRWLERLQLRDRAESRVETLSKGLAQKVQFLTAVVHDPTLVILDEPFSALDPVNAEVLREVVLELRRSGTTVVLSSHDMAAAEQLCDEVVMLHRGRKVLDGSVDEIKARRGVETVRLRFTGAVPDLSQLPGVSDCRDYGREQTLELAPGASAQAVLEALVTRASLQRFEVSRPSLHEIFVSIARPREGDHA